MSDVNFLKKLQEYDANNIPEATIKKLKPYIENKDFQPAVSSKILLTVLKVISTLFSLDRRKSLENSPIHVFLGHRDEQIR